MKSLQSFPPPRLSIPRRPRPDADATVFIVTSLLFLLALFLLPGGA